MVFSPIDIEESVSSHLAGAGFNASPVPLPQSFCDSLPFVLVTRTGGQSVAPMNDLHLVSVDIYADTWDEANDVAASAIKSVRSMPGSVKGFYSCDCNMAYANPDPRHKNLPRLTFSASIVAAGKE